MIGTSRESVTNSLNCYRRLKIEYSSTITMLEKAKAKYELGSSMYRTLTEEIHDTTEAYGQICKCIEAYEARLLAIIDEETSTK